MERWLNQVRVISLPDCDKFVFNIVMQDEFLKSKGSADTRSSYRTREGGPPVVSVRGWSPETRQRRRRSKKGVYDRMTKGGKGFPKTFTVEESLREGSVE